MLGFFFKLRNYSIRTVQMSTEYCGGVSNYKQHFLEMRGSLLVEPSVGFFFFFFSSHLFHPHLGVVIR